jgi:hypothetical protein
VQAALRKREEEDAARRSTQQGEIERAVLAALKKREQEQAAAQSARAEKENQEAKLAIERLNKELAELRAAREAAPPAAPRPSPTPATAAPQSPPSAPVQLALAAPSAPRATPAFSVGGRIERPDVRAGDRWKYEVTDGYTNLKHAVVVEVASVTESRIYTQSSRTTLAATGLGAAAGAIDVWDRDWNQLRHGEQEYTPHYPWQQFPLESGKTWSGRTRYSGAGMIAVNNTLTAKVEGWERVTVPAGTFDVVKITIQGHFTAESGAGGIGAGVSNGRINHVIWYSPAVRQAVKKEIALQDFNRVSNQSQSERWELLEYKAD